MDSKKRPLLVESEEEREEEEEEEQKEELWMKKDVILFEKISELVNLWAMKSPLSFSHVIFG